MMEGELSDSTLRAYMRTVKENNLEMNVSYFFDQWFLFVF